MASSSPAPPPADDPFADWPLARPRPVDRILARGAAERPDVIAVEHEGASVTYAELARRAWRFAEFVRAHDAERPVLLVLDNGVDFPVAYLGIACAGATVVPVNPLLKGPELAFIARDTGARAIVTTAAKWEAVAGPLREAGVERVVLTDLSPDWPGVPGSPGSPGSPGAGVEAFTRLLEGPAAAPAPLPEAALGRPLALMYTSGTTGQPKGAVLTHGSLMAVIVSTNEIYGTDADDVFLCMLPMWHVYAATDCLLLPLFLGATVVSTKRSAPAEVLELVVQRGITCFASIPSVFATLADAPPLDLGHLKLCMSAGTALPRQVLDACEQRYGVPILEGYGLTEASATVTMNPVQGRRKVGSVGVPIPGIEAQIVDDDDRECAPDEVGEVRVRGPSVMLGYHGRPEATAAAVRGGWLYTGDLARYDEDRYIYIVDRKKDMFSHQGLHVYPREVEEVIHHFEGVREVAVVGLGGDDVDEIVAVLSELSPGAIDLDGLRAHCAERLADFKLPTRYEVVESYPRTGSGKIAKHELRAQLEAERAP